MIANQFVWVSLADVLQLFPISRNTNEQKFKQAVALQMATAVVNQLPSSMYAAIDALLRDNLAQYQADTTYNVGAIVYYNDAYYKAIEATAANLPTDTDYWQVHELLTFFQQYVKNWVCALAWAGYLPMHGRNVTEWGIEQQAQEGFQSVDSKARAELICDANKWVEVYYRKMDVALNDANYTFDGTKYGTTSPCGTTDRNRNSFSNIGAGSRRFNNRNDNRYGYDRY